MKISTNGYGKEKRFTELVLYISTKLSDDQYLGGVKLNKVLYFSDFTAFGLLGRTITGMEYQHLPEGPAPRAMYPIQQRMVQAGVLAIEPTPIYKRVQNRPRPLRDPEMSYFSGQEIAIVDRWIERLRPLTGKQVSDLSHDTFGWRTTVDGETIDPRTVFIAYKKPDASDVARGQELAKKYGLMA
ncbi:MAG: Panacea domain-containing protein [Terracidiphilus sp.]